MNLTKSAVACLILSGALSCNKPESLPDGFVAVPYAATAPAGELASGALPDGLSLDSPTGEISGTPEQAGKFEFTVRTTDSLKKLSIRILVAGGGQGSKPVPETEEPDTESNDCYSRFLRVPAWTGEVTVKLDTRWVGDDGHDWGNATLDATAPLDLRRINPNFWGSDLEINPESRGKVSVEYRAKAFRHIENGGWHDGTLTVALEKSVPLESTRILMKDPESAACSYNFHVFTEPFEIEQVVSDPSGLAYQEPARESGALGFMLESIPLPESGTALKGSRTVSFESVDSPRADHINFDGGFTSIQLDGDWHNVGKPAVATISWNLTPSKTR